MPSLQNKGEMPSLQNKGKMPSLQNKGKMPSLRTFLHGPGLDAAPFGPAFIHGLELLDLLRMLLGQVMKLGAVGFEVVQFPLAGMP